MLYHIMSKFAAIQILSESAKIPIMPRFTYQLMSVFKIAAFSFNSRRCEKYPRA